jgi:NAD(P)-dependent dehydrogenase (short-subunit alcohol dehydrogenase family)
MTASGVRKVDRLINCAGINFLAPFNDISEDDWDRVMNTNAKGILFTTQALLDHLKAGAGTVLNIVSNASHMPMTHSAVYNASKGAAHILTLQMARELTRSHGLTVFGISPAKIEGTGMSRYIERQVPALRGWTSEEAAEYQKAGLLTGMEIPPWVLAEFIVWLLTDKQRHFWFDGCVIPYGA